MNVLERAVVRTEVRYGDEWHQIIVDGRLIVAEFPERAWADEFARQLNELMPPGFPTDAALAAARAALLALVGARWFLAEMLAQAAKPADAFKWLAERLRSGHDL